MTDTILNPSFDLKTVGKDISKFSGHSALTERVSSASDTKLAETFDKVESPLSSSSKSTKLNKDEFNIRVDSVNKQLVQFDSYLKFERDENTDKMVIFIKHSKTDEILMQIPSEEFLKISKNIEDYLAQTAGTSDDSEKHSLPAGMIMYQKV